MNFSSPLHQPLLKLENSSSRCPDSSSASISKYSKYRFYPDLLSVKPAKDLMASSGINNLGRVFLSISKTCPLDPPFSPTLNAFFRLKASRFPFSFYFPLEAKGPDPAIPTPPASASTFLVNLSDECAFWQQVNR